MKSTCIPHPENEPLIICRRWQIEFCDGNRCAAMLMSFFEYWHNVKCDMVRKNSQANTVAENHGDERTQDETVWQFHNTQELIDGLLGFYGETLIRAALMLLVEKQVLEIGKNPNPRYKFDNTKWFLFKPEVASAWLAARSVEIPTRLLKNNGSGVKNNGSSGISEESSGKITGSSGKTNGTITENTSEIPTETTSKTLSLSVSNGNGKNAERERDNKFVSEKPKKSENKKNQGKSKYDISICLEYVRHLATGGVAVSSPLGLARTMLDGSNDIFIEAWLIERDTRQTQESKPEREFTDEPCTKCFGAKLEIVPGKGARACSHCVNENGERTGLEPVEPIADRAQDAETAAAATQENYE